MRTSSIVLMTVVAVVGVTVTLNLMLGNRRRAAAVTSPPLQTPASTTAANGGTSARAMDYRLRPFFDAAARGNEEAMRVALQAEPDVNATDEQGNTALHLATRYFDHAKAIKVIDMLLSRGAKINAAGDRENTPLMVAVQDATDSLSFQDPLAVVKELLSHGASVNARDAAGRTALHRACDGSHRVVISFLLEKAKADPNAADNDGETPLHLAAAAGDTNAAALLVPAGAKVNVRDAKGYTPLKRANLSFRNDVASYLKAKGGTE